MRFSGSSWAIAAVAALSLSALTLLPAQAEEVKSADTLVKGLAPVKTRGFDPTAPTREAKQHELNTKLREFKTRQITVEERTEVVKLIEESKSPNVDVQILFAFDSADILPEAKPSLDELGKALTDPKLTGGAFLIAGHTDAKGSDEYNLALSQRRAASVKAFLVETYKVDEGRLSVIGFGEEQLKNKEDPLADENRRVQIVNTGSAAVAEGKPAEAAPEPEAAPKQEAAPAEAAPAQDAEPEQEARTAARVSSHIRRSGDGEALLDAAEQTVAHPAIGRENLLAIAAGHGSGRASANIRRRWRRRRQARAPYDALPATASRSGRRTCRARSPSAVGRCPEMSMPISSMTATAKGSVSPGAHACRLYIDAPAGEMAQDGGGHRRAHSVAAAGEEDRARQVGVSHRQGIIPSSGARR